MDDMSKAGNKLSNLQLAQACEQMAEEMLNKTGMTYIKREFPIMLTEQAKLLRERAEKERK
jgi:hypothetical protein